MFTFLSNLFASTNSVVMLNGFNYKEVVWTYLVHTRYSAIGHIKLMDKEYLAIIEDSSKSEKSQYEKRLENDLTSWFLSLNFVKCMSLNSELFDYQKKIYSSIVTQNKVYGVEIRYFLKKYQSKSKTNVGITNQNLYTDIN